LLQQQNVWFYQQNVWLQWQNFWLQQQFFFVVPNFVAVTKPFFSVLREKTLSNIGAGGVARSRKFNAAPVDRSSLENQ